MINPPKRNSLQTSSLALINFLERCWRLELAKQPTCLTGILEIDETACRPVNSRTSIAIWAPLIWLYL
ncbi:MAG: hypothetical protein KME07_01880 [Pegethrix bostrychoides GSE-TBD4-15B]|jgi:hypothetical protein|uniref:Transposase n=1 Tax=Pegethrix bostrychoides GSE-TBD4-15B TaxID=2839662 RepID=A0A951U312_9CYAN|nr:hypothetical protein [Pegethrix bostrychoides GSE-TBD4-15B]